MNKVEKGSIPIRNELEWCIELHNGKQFRNVDAREANKILSNLNENENVCFTEDTGKIVRKICIPMRNIQYIYTILENKDKTQ